MSQPPNRSASSRKKLTKCSSTSTSSRNSDHRLERISSISSYLVDNEDDDTMDGLGRGSFMNASKPFADSDRDSTNRVHRRMDKTTSITMFSGGRKFWNCNAKPTSFYVPDNATIREESEMIAGLTKQLCLVESQLQKIQSDLKKTADQLTQKDEEIVRLKRKVKDCENKSKNQEALRKKEQEERRVQTDHSEHLHQRCLMLEQKIFEMEKFLSDYGLIWVGDTNSPKCPETIPNNFIDACYNDVIANIDQLNLAAGKGEVHVQHNKKGNGASFKTPSCMCLQFYKNGMVVQGGPLRSYNDPATISFLRDILEGYYPSELQPAYPDGVPFKVEDHRNRMHMDNSAEFPGHGYRLGKQHPIDKSSRTRRPNSKIQKTPRQNTLQTDHVSNLEFRTTKHMPLSVRSMKSKSSTSTQPVELFVLRSQILASHNNICSNTHLQSHINAELGLSNRQGKRDSPMKNGIQRFPSSGRCYHSSTERSSPRQSSRSRSASLPNSRLSVNVKAVTQAKPSDSVNWNVTHLPNYQATRKTQRPLKSAEPFRKNAPPILHQLNEPTGARAELRLKVRSLNGGTIYLVHVSADDPIARLYQLLDRAMARTVPRGYKIVVSGYSSKRLEHLGSTLREIGITRDSVLHLVNI